MASEIFHWIPTIPEWLGQPNETEFDVMLKSSIGGFNLDNMTFLHTSNLNTMLHGPTMIVAWNVASEEKILNPTVLYGEKIGFIQMPNSSETMVDYYKKNFGINLKHESSPVVRGMDGMPHPIEMISLRMSVELTEEMVEEDDEELDSQEEEDELQELDLDFGIFEDE